MAKVCTSLFGLFENFRWQAVFRTHVPFALPVLAYEGGDKIIHKCAAGIAHHDLFFGQAALIGDHLPFPPWSVIGCCSSAAAIEK